MLLTAILVVILGATGYLGAREIGPYFGTGYSTGTSVVVDNVKFTLVEVRCGLRSAPGSSIKPTGQFCLVDVKADNRADNGAFVDFHDWSVNLDVGINDVPPTVAAMPLPVAVVLKGDPQTLRLVFDVPTGARLSALNIKIGDHTSSIPISIAK